MNLNFINREFERLETLQECIDYQFEPKSKNIGGKRNIYYEDLKQDFVNEVNTFGFSPFILEGFEKQRKNPNVMKYMNKKFNHGLTNYVRKQNQAVKYKEKERQLQEKKRKDKAMESQQASIHFKMKEEPQAAKKEIFLRKALENLAHNKLNISTEEDHLFEEDKDDEISNDNIYNKNEKTEDIQKMLVEANKKRIIEQLREKYLKSIRDQPENLPKITIAEFEKPNALKVNFENLFIKKRKGGKGMDKKIVALSKNKDYLFTGVAKQNITKTDGNQNVISEGGAAFASSKPTKSLKDKKKVKFWLGGGSVAQKQYSSSKLPIKSQTITSPGAHKDKFMLLVRAKKYCKESHPAKTLNTFQTE